jgi:hypothetical protein
VPRARLKGARVATLLAVGALGAVPIFASSCAADTDEASVRSLERTGKAAFVCMGVPGSALRTLADCSNQRREEVTDFGEDDSAGHLYAVVTLETRGEIAVVDVTSKRSSVLDQDVSTPGDNPLPVGAQPVDIVAPRNLRHRRGASASVRGRSRPL